MVEFVKRHRDELEALAPTFLSVSLNEAGAEDHRRSGAERAKAATDVQQKIDQFPSETGWRPKRVKAVGGALLYSRYNFFIRFIMKRIAKKNSMPTDTSRDYEYTDWNAIARVVDEVLSDHVAEPDAQDAPALA
jgi:menaquinone-dependent protoporphyrinogen oxidase